MLLETDSYQSFLNEELARRMKNNPRYSQRAFARQLGLSAGELSEILQGKRKLSLKSSLKIARAMNLNAAETQHLVFLTAALPPAARGDSETTPRARQLSLDIFHIVSDWFCFALLNLADCDGFRDDPAWIARRLGITRLQATLALERLERVGLMTRMGGRLVATPEYVLSPAGIPSEAVRSGHRALLAKAEEALDFQKIEEREISGVGLALDPRHLENIKKEISEFQDRIIAKYSEGKKTEVYQLEIAFFRLTETKGN